MKKKMDIMDIVKNVKKIIALEIKKRLGQNKKYIEKKIKSLLMNMVETTIRQFSENDMLLMKNTERKDRFKVLNLYIKEEKHNHCLD